MPPTHAPGPDPDDDDVLDGLREALGLDRSEGTLFSEEEFVVPAALLTPEEEAAREMTRLEKQLNKRGVRLVGFGAQWCVPWILLAPTLKELEQSGVEVVRIDVERQPILAERYRIVSVPTFMVFDNGKERRRVLGAVGAQDLSRAIERASTRAQAERAKRPKRKPKTTS